MILHLICSAQASTDFQQPEAHLASEAAAALSDFSCLQLEKTASLLVVSALHLITVSEEYFSFTIRCFAGNQYVALLACFAPDSWTSLFSWSFLSSRGGSCV